MSSQPYAPLLPSDRHNDPDPTPPILQTSFLLQLYRQNTGLCFVAGAQFFFAMMNVTVKYFIATSPISTLMLIFVRQVFTGVACLLTLYSMNDPHYFLGPPEVRPLLAARGFFGFIGLASNYQSFRYLSVSDSVTIGFLTPSFTALLALFLLREHLSGRDVLAGFFCLTGVILVSRPPFLFGHGQQIDIPSPSDGGDEGPILPGRKPTIPDNSPERMLGVIWALISVVGSSIAFIVIRHIGDRAHAMHTMAYFSYLCTVVTAV
ncbi:hypothetical protein TREMEDRAFT_33807 [Tremella mesenterica DSM 1558]|nr:uncharacterized protein TREMEDRAFT_33807 [Tremella mesenterica DSM 1558]EIW67350.1 hypothetical protein TREMEDRAFT_33807 [Tremella mesenterica DSM 1558]